MSETLRRTIRGTTTSTRPTNTTTRAGSGGFACLLAFYFCLLAVRFSECIHDGTRVLNAFLRPITLMGRPRVTLVKRSNLHLVSTLFTTCTWAVS